MISKILNSSNSNLIHESLISRVFILLNDIIVKSKKVNLRRFSVVCYSSISKNHVFNKRAMKSINQLPETQRKLVFLYLKK